jgi:hypothetical protein
MAWIIFPRWEETKQKMNLKLLVSSALIFGVKARVEGPKESEWEETKVTFKKWMTAQLRNNFKEYLRSLHGTRSASEKNYLIFKN